MQWFTSLRGMQAKVSRDVNTSRPLGRAPPRVTQAGLTLRPIPILGWDIHKLPILHTMPYMLFTQCQLCIQCHLCNTDNANCAHNAICFVRQCQLCIQCHICNPHNAKCANNAICARYTMPIMHTMPFMHTMPYMLAIQCQLCTQCQFCNTFGIGWLHIWHWMGAYLALTDSKLL